MERFSHFLQPLKDVAENFNIDIAHELEDYLAELETISISFDGGATSLNFAEGFLFDFFGNRLHQNHLETSCSLDPRIQCHL